MSNTTRSLPILVKKENGLFTAQVMGSSIITYNHSSEEEALSVLTQKVISTPDKLDELYKKHENVDFYFKWISV